MKNQHTPGPWAVDPATCESDYGALQRDGSRYLLQRYVRHGVSSGRIAACFANCLVTTDAELEANARLIAAAPELLAALRALVCNEDHGFYASAIESGCPSGLDLDKWCEKAKAVIAKATGASNEL